MTLLTKSKESSLNNSRRNSGFCIFFFLHISFYITPLPKEREKYIIILQQYKKFAHTQFSSAMKHVFIRQL